MIIAEASHNHCGRSELLRDMINASAESGARYFKIQTHFASDLRAEWRTDFDRVSRYQLNWDHHHKVAEWCAQAKMIPMTSVYSFRYAKDLWDAGFRDIKIGSAQALDEDLIVRYKTAGFRVFVSSGGHDIRNLPRRAPHAWFHCVSQYPTPPYEANLSRMLELKQAFPSTPIGFSSHIDPTHKDWALPLKLASFMGAVYTEAHFTLLPRSDTKDGAVSLDAHQLKEICQFDALPFDAKREHHGWFGTIVSPQKKSEVELISRYRGRFQS